MAETKLVILYNRFISSVLATETGHQDALPTTGVLEAPAKQQLSGLRQNYQLCINGLMGEAAEKLIMADQFTNTMRLYNQRNERLYLNASELQRFISAAKNAAAPQRRFALTLAYTGIRLSEARALRGESIQLEARAISIRTLKKRQRHVIRELPIPKPLVAEYRSIHHQDESLLWQVHGRPIPRITAYRWIKTLMVEAQISGPKACPKGLRHAYGTRAILSGVPLHMLQLWMGHASMRTTAIYATVLGPEQLELSDRMW
jgi:Site-specific recombinase XerD